MRSVSDVSIPELGALEGSMALDAFTPGRCAPQHKPSPASTYVMCIHLDR